MTVRPEENSVHINAVDNVVLCVSCVQLTDDVNVSIADAVQRFIDSCTSAGLRPNDRVDEEDTHVAVANVPPEQPSCPRCLTNIMPHAAVCCDNGVCVNYTCQCNEGWCNQYQ